MGGAEHASPRIEAPAALSLVLKSPFIFDQGFMGAADLVLLIQIDIRGLVVTGEVFIRQRSYADLRKASGRNSTSRQCQISTFNETNSGWTLRTGGTCGSSSSGCAGISLWSLWSR